MPSGSPAWPRVDPKLLRPIQPRGEAAQADRALLRSRDALLVCRTKMINHARGIVKSMGGRLPSGSTPGLAMIRIGAEAIYDRARKDGRLDLALAAAVIAGEVPPQRLISGARMTSIEVAPYVHRGVGGTSITLPDRRFEELRKIALDGPDRRFRLEACGSLSFIATFGSEVQSKQAKQVLEVLADSQDTVVASNARWHLANPVDREHLGRLLAQEE